ncbi:MAG: glycosyltransferase family 2 protein [Verrucomicrobiota bacterium]
MKTLINKTAAVVASHKMYETMPDCLTGLLTSVEKPEDLIFVDNGSGGELTKWAQENFPGITVLTREENGHYCGGFNEGLRHAIEANYDYVAVVNADSIVQNPKFLEQLAERMEAMPEAAFLGPQVWSDREGSVQNTIDTFPNIWHKAAVWLPYRFLPKRSRSSAAAESEVDFLNGVCVLCRCDALRKIGLLDESFGGYVEDADWSWRGLEKGWKSAFTPIPSVIHEMEAHGYAHHSPKVFLLKRNTVYWYLKAGRSIEARVYAKAAILLAIFRWLFAKSSEERYAKACFIRELRFEYRTLFEAAKVGQPFSPLPMEAFKRLLAIDC